MASVNQVPRMLSLDAFRGFTIAAMLLVNNPGDWAHLYGPLEHAKWNGWTFTDWIFPFFLFIGGISMAFSLGRRAEAGADKRELLLKLWKRAALIFLIGLILNLIPYFNFEKVRIMGVLQRIALCTALAAPIVLYFNWRQQCAWIIGLLSVYTGLMLFLPVPDINGVVVAGALEPGRDVGAYIDRLFLTGHMWVTSKIWDPEGLFTTIPAVCSQLFGVLAGRWLLSEYSQEKKTIWMLLSGLLCLWLASIIDFTFMSINKSLWTTSYCILTTGWGLIMFATFYWFLDANDSLPMRERAAKFAQAFVIYGMNALFIFALSGFIAKMLGFIKLTDSEGKAVALKTILYAPIKALPIGEVNTSLIFAIVFNLVMFAIAWAMWKRRWFIKV